MESLTTINSSRLGVHIKCRQSAYAQQVDSGPNLSLVWALPPSIGQMYVSVGCWRCERALERTLYAVGGEILTDKRR